MGPSTPRLRLETVTTDGRVVVLVHGELAAGTPTDLAALLDRLFADEDLEHLEIDLESAPFVDSSGIGVLADAIRRTAARGGTTTLHRPPERVREVIELTGLGDHLAE
jgi:anti-anti-sigma factor